MLTPVAHADPEHAFVFDLVDRGIKGAIMVFDGTFH
jgi:hypothetical protein